MNGQQKGAENLKTFEKWVKERFAANDWEGFIRGGILNRTKIAGSCGFGTSVLRQNPSVEASLKALEDSLRHKGILPLGSHVHSREISGPPAYPIEAGSPGFFGTKVTAIQDENAALKHELRCLKKRLEQYELRDKHLAETGRMLKL